MLGTDAHQRGSNITVNRMRFDFNCDHKLTPEEKEKIEYLVMSGYKWITSNKTKNEKRRQ
ncbi:MAG: hypothetical protein V8R81_04705 [Clostridia bacterium]